MSMADINVLRANFILAELDSFTAVTLHDRILAECAKAITVAKATPNIEAMVISPSIVDAVVARALLAVKASKVGGKWDEKSGTIEFPNGSAVRSVLENPQSSTKNRKRP